jgi:CBS domain-containing protein
MTRSTGPIVVGELMAVDPVVIGANLPLDEAADILDRHRISGAPVVDAAGSLVGVLSQTDLIRARSTEYLWANWPGLAVRHLMTSPAVTVERSTPIVIAAARMERHRIHRLVVVADDDKTLPIGILSTTDVVHSIAENARAAAVKAGRVPDESPGSAVDG